MSDRLLELYLDGEKDEQFVVSELHTQEAISRLFRYHVTVSITSSESAPAQSQECFQKFLGRNLAVSLALTDTIGAERRFFSGICNRVLERGIQPLPASGQTIFTYVLDIVPEVWLATQTVRYRIFQQVSVEDILAEVLDPYAERIDLRREHQMREYCVQYGESDFDFVSRLMEEEGIYYTFLHTSASNRMMISDSKYFDFIPAEPQLTYHLVPEAGQSRVDSWKKRHQLAAAKYTLRDHAFERYAQPVLTWSEDLPESIVAGKVTHALHLNLASTVVNSNLDLENSAYPGGFAKWFSGISPGGSELPDRLNGLKAAHTTMVHNRQQQAAAELLTIDAHGDCRNFAPGFKFMLDGHEHADGDYLITAVHQRARQSGNWSGGGAVVSGHPSYENFFTCIPAAVSYTPQRLTRTPVVAGCQTATVVGQTGQEIFTDAYGRVKVRFHWDTGSAGENGSSCWIRVGGSWSGGYWGSVHIPRVGQEVIVAFLEGDPDQPIIVGTVYNARNMPATPLPDTETQSGIRSRSTPAGAVDSFNEIRFEDHTGQEQFITRAQKDRLEVVKNDSHFTIGRDHMTIVGADQSLIVKGSHHALVGNRIAIEAENEIHLKSKNIVIEGTENISITTGAGQFIVLEANGDITIKTSGNMVHKNCGGSESRVGAGVAAVSPLDPYSSGGETDG